MSLTSLIGVILSIFAFGLGCLIGRLRGGSWSGVTSARINGTGWLVLGITTILVLNIIGPAFPIAWALLGAVSFIVFGFKNLQITGMIVMMIGLLMNAAPIVANGAMPVSDLALQSVGQIDENGVAEITGLRESTSTATGFAAFGDVIPVPIVNTVVSLGDLVMLIALADISANLFLRARRRELDDAGVTYTEAVMSQPAPSEHVEILSPLHLGSRPAHAAHRRPRRKAAPSTHVPAHAAMPDSAKIDLTESAAPQHAAETSTVIDLTESAAPQHAAENSAAEVEAETVIDLTEAAPTTVDLTDPADHRPIIDLTVSPTDDQLCEFLRRRELADAKLNEPLAPGPRRGRAPRRTAGVAELHQ